MFGSDPNEAAISSKWMRRSSMVKKKLGIIAYGNSISINATSNKYKIDRSSIRPRMKKNGIEEALVSFAFLLLAYY